MKHACPPRIHPLSLTFVLCAMVGLLLFLLGARMAIADSEGPVMTDLVVSSTVVPIGGSFTVTFTMSDPDGVYGASLSWNKAGSSQGLAGQCSPPEPYPASYDCVVLVEVPDVFTAGAFDPGIFVVRDQYMNYRYIMGALPNISVTGGVGGPGGTATLTATQPASPTRTPTATQPPSATMTPTNTSTLTPTPSPSPTSTITPTLTTSPTATSTGTATPSPTPSPTPTVSLSVGSNLITWPSGDMPIAAALAALPRPVVALYEWDSEAHRWKRYLAGVPSFVNNLQQVRTGATYWVIAQ